MQKAIALNPNSSLLYNELGRAYYGLGDTKSAKAAWSKSLELNPDNKKAEKNLKLLERH